MEYLTRAEAMQMFKISERSIDRYIDDINCNYLSRYGTRAVIKSTGIVRVDRDALIDYLQNRDKLKVGMFIPKFRHKEGA